MESPPGPRPSPAPARRSVTTATSSTRHGTAAAVHTIETATHGRYLVDPAAAPAGAPLLVGFHGYGEHAERHLAELRRIPGSGPWLRVAVQSLHRHYSADRRHVVGSWMTREDRELAIADNIAYARRVVDAVRERYAAGDALVYCGFSQGVAMAYRAAARAGHPCRGVIALGGDVPPELRTDPGNAWPRVLIGRGRTDTWYTQDRLEADRACLEGAGAAVETLVFDGGHEWTAAFRAAAGRFLAALC